MLSISSIYRLSQCVKTGSILVHNGIDASLKQWQFDRAAKTKILLINLLRKFKESVAREGTKMVIT